MEKRRNTTGILGGVALAGVIGLKYKAALYGLVSFLKFGWLFKGFWTMTLSLGLYSMVYGWQFAIVLIALLFIHEMGHWIWMKAYGLDPKAPVFVPFLGAYVEMTKLPPDEATRAWVAYAGPLVGGAGSAIAYAIGSQLDWGWLMAGAAFGFVLNLLQLIPAKPLDGGFIISAISRWLLVPGTILFCVLAFYFKSVLLVIIAALSAFSLFASMKHDGPPESGLVLASASQRAVLGFAYVLLAGLLGSAYVLAMDHVKERIRSAGHSSPSVVSTLKEMEQKEGTHEGAQNSRMNQ